MVEEIAYHEARASLGALVKQQVWYGRGRVRLRAKAVASAGRSSTRRSEASLRGLAWLRLLVRKRRLDLLPIFFVSATAHYVGEALEMAALAKSHFRGGARQPSIESSWPVRPELPCGATRHHKHLVWAPLSCPGDWPASRLETRPRAEADPPRRQSRRRLL